MRPRGRPQRLPDPKDRDEGKRARRRDRGPKPAPATDLEPALYPLEQLAGRVGRQQATQLGLKLV